MSCPIIFLTARVEDADMIDGFASGGGDYVAKPFSLQVLGARVAAQLAREKRRSTSSVVRMNDDISIDFRRMQVMVHGAPVSLPRKEYEICAFLAYALAAVVAAVALSVAVVGASAALYSQATEQQTRYSGVYLYDAQRNALVPTTSVTWYFESADAGSLQLQDASG